MPNLPRAQEINNDDVSNVKIVAQYEHTCTNQLGPHGHCGNERPGGCESAILPLQAHPVTPQRHRHLRHFQCCPLHWPPNFSRRGTAQCVLRSALRFCLLETMARSCPWAAVRGNQTAKRWELPHRSCAAATRHGRAPKRNMRVLNHVPFR